MSRDDDQRAGRRAFFRLGAGRIRDRVLDAARELSHASQEVSREIARDDSGVRAETFHRDRLRGQPGPRRLERRVIRPPGAIAEPDFIAACEKTCAACLEACPEDAIVHASPGYGPAVEMTPILIVEQRPCVMCSDVPCAAACPTGALQAIEGQTLAIGTARVLEGLCLNRLGEPCQVCYDNCPVGGAMAAQADGVPFVAADRCTGCGLCVSACKAFPKALIVLPR